MRTTKHLHIHGRVQGVFFRESLSQKARELGITGWVTNRSDGSVEAMLQGTETAVAAAIEWARHGPSFAHVDKLEIADGWGEYSDFQRLPTP